MNKTISNRFLPLTLIILFFCITVSAQVVINEYSASNLESDLDNFSNYEDWVELYNTGTSSINLSGYYLSDKIFSPAKWKIPSGITIPAGGFLVFWASGKDMVSGNNYHTNFKLSQTKKTNEYLVLANADSILIDTIRLSKTQLGHSRGRTTDGASTWSVFAIPTLKKSNNTSAFYDEYASKPIMSHAPGFYTGTIPLSLSILDSNAIIRFTTDGSEPTSLSTIYSNPLTISSTTIVKAKTYSSDNSILPGFIEFNTFFINESHSLVVVSVASEELEFLLNGDKSYFPVGSWEYFDKTGIRQALSYGEYNSHGQDSWVHDQRSIDFISRDEMGYRKAIREKIFSSSARNSFQRIIMRAEGDDNYPGIDSSAHLRDMYVQTLADRAKLNLDLRKAERCVMYVNGKYWGVYSLREKVDDPDFMDYYHGQSKKDIQFIMTWGWTWVEFGDSVITMANWYDLYDFITNNDMSIAANYSTVISQYDVTSLVDYILVNSYVVCTDWLNYNVGWWRGLNPLGGHQKWGYILWDEDATFGHYINYTGVPSQTPDLDPCYPEDLTNWWSDPEGHVTILNKLRENPEFNQYYISRYIDLMNTHFSCDTMISLLDEIVTLIEPEMPQQVARWGGSVSKWQSNIELMKDFITYRCNFIDQGLKNCYSLTGPYDIKVSAQPPTAGSIKLNSLILDQFPFTGSYYGGVDVKLSALETDTNYLFDHWIIKTHNPSPDTSSISITLTISSSDSIVAVFKAKQPVVINIDDPDYNNNSFSIYPNPFTINTTINVDSRKALTDGEFIIFDVTGKKLKTTRIKSNRFTINRNGLEDGMYFFKIKETNGDLIGTGKFVVN